MKYPHFVATFRQPKENPMKLSLPSLIEVEIYPHNPEASADQVAGMSEFQIYELCDALHIDPDDVAKRTRQVIQEATRRQRIADGLEPACRECGCSETRACPGGCIWAKENLCSRCAMGGNA